MIKMETLPGYFEGWNRRRCLIDCFEELKSVKLLSYGGKTRRKILSIDRSQGESMKSSGVLNGSLIFLSHLK